MKGFVKKKTTRIAGIITVLAVALVIGVVTALATSTTPAAQAISPLRVAIYIGPVRTRPMLPPHFALSRRVASAYTASRWTISRMVV